MIDSNKFQKISSNRAVSQQNKQLFHSAVQVLTIFDKFDKFQLLHFLKVFKTWVSDDRFQ